jgi:hypothetical protein
MPGRASQAPMIKAFSDIEFNTAPVCDRDMSEAITLEANRDGKG